MNNEIILSVERKNTVILVPSYEPDCELKNVVKGLYKAGYQILVVNDGSSEEYDPIFNDVNQYCSYLKSDRNYGKGHALKIGYQYILDNFKDVDYVITADGDGQHSLEDINNINDILNEKDDIVLGIRHFDETMPANSKVGNTMSKVARALFLKKYLPDDQCGLRGFPSRYLKEMTRIGGNRYEYEMNVVSYIQLKEYRYHLAYIKTIYINENSKSHFKDFLDTFHIQKVIFFNAIPNLLCLVGAMIGMILLYYNNISFNHLIPTCIYLGANIIYNLILMISHPTKRLLKRLGKELMISIPKSVIVLLLLYLFITILNFHPIAGVILSTILVAFSNFAFAYLLRVKPLEE